MFGVGNNSVGPPALDILLKTLISAPEFNGLKDKNWTSISRMIPGTTARQCQKRYEELLKEEMSQAAEHNNKPTVVSSSSSLRSTRAEVDPTEHRASRPGSGRVKSSKSDKDSSSVKSYSRPVSADQGPVMVIHVCDEAKNVKQDFHCPRDLLVCEMKYFAEYLSTDAQRWEEVDISVHCDVQIFDWLMKFVKRKSKEVDIAPKLEPTNVISILISSDFLKMDNLTKIFHQFQSAHREVDVCIQFCHDNMTAIVATPCNMNCINDRLVTRIADLFTHNEADEVKDRKDKFKSKLFQKKIEKLFEANGSSSCSPENATTLYRCSVCKRLLTHNLQNKVKCLQSRMSIDAEGGLVYRHVRDASWDVNEHLLELKAQLKSWREVYWRLWGVLNFLQCSRCGENFSCSDLGHCKYHPEPAKFDNYGQKTTALGVYPCCEQKVLRFDPTQPNKGCKVRDHVVNIQTGSESGGGGTEGGKQTERESVYNDLLAHRDLVCVAYQRLQPVNEGDDRVDIFALEEQVLGLRSENFLNRVGSDAAMSEDGKTESKPRLQALTMEREVSCDEDFGLSEDDEVGDEEEVKTVKRTKPRRSRVTVDPQAILLDAPSFITTKTRKWDSSRSLRWNQDAQREEDQRRMNDIVTYLTKLRLSQDRLDKVKAKEYAGGLFSKLEAQWKAVYMPPPKAPNTFQFRNKPKIGSIQK